MPSWRACPVELAAIYLPKELVEEAKRKGLDLEAEP